MKYRLLATDMDGSLLNSKIEIGQATVDRINKALEKDVEVVLATGRLHASAYKYARGLGVDLPIISNNGATIKDKNGKTLYENTLDEIKLRKIISVIEDLGIYYHLYTSDKVYSRETNLDFLRRYYGLEDGSLAVETAEFDKIDDLFKADLKINKVLASSQDKDELERLKREILKIQAIEVTSSWEDNIEIMNEGVSKGRALEILLDSLNISKAEAIAVGDNENDLSMIEYAGLGVAMGNAKEIVKEKADFITRTNDEDGLGYVIEKFIL